jgi:hypothetical protein
MSSVVSTDDFVLAIVKGNVLENSWFKASEDISATN